MVLLPNVEVAVSILIFSLDRLFGLLGATLIPLRVFCSFDSDHNTVHIYTYFHAWKLLLVVTVEKMPVNTCTHGGGCRNGGVTIGCCLATRVLHVSMATASSISCTEHLWCAGSRVCLAMSAAFTSAQKIGRDPKCLLLDIVYGLAIPQSMCGG